MVRTLKVVVLLMAAIVISTLPASAQCVGVSQIFGHAIGAFISGCADAEPVAGFAYAPGTSAITPEGLNIICEADGEAAQGATGCFGSGAAGDGNVTIDGNWGSPGVTGCPNQAGNPGAGRNYMVVRDNRGAGVILSVGYSIDFAGYVADLAHKADFSLSCQAADGTGAASQAVRVMSVSKGGDATTTQVSFVAEALPPTVFSDCDPDSAGVAFGLGTCTEGSLVPAGAGSLYTRVADCSGRDLALNRSGWSPATGEASYPSSQCLFVGASAMIGTGESSGIVGSAVIAGNLAARPSIANLRARQQGGKVIVDFNTTSEVGLNSLAIFASDGRKVADVPRRSSGGEGATYSVTTERSTYRGVKGLYVAGETTEGRITSGETRF